MTDVVRLCRALDRLPLAIELAAARARVLSVAEILARLDDRFALLADAVAGRPARRRSLAAALAWSYDLLAPDDQRGLWALAAFPDGATLPALEHVLAALPTPISTALDVVGRLVERSLVVVDQSIGSGQPGGTRYRLLDSVRAFARERAAEAGVADVLADAVVGWVAAMAATVAAGVRGPDQAALVARTAAERATVDTALDRARQDDPVTGLRIAADLGWAWVLLDDVAAAARLRAPAPRRRDAPRDLRRGRCCWRAGSRRCPATCAAARRALDAADGARRRRPAGSPPGTAGSCCSRRAGSPRRLRPSSVPGGVRGPRRRVGGGRQRAAGRLRPPRPGRHHARDAPRARRRSAS